jgi:hypothetical protein
MRYSREMSTIPQTTTGLREGGGLNTWVLPQRAGLSIFFKCTSTFIFTGGNFY